MRRQWPLLVVVVGLAVTSCRRSPGPPVVPAATRQLVVGTTAAWDLKDVTLRRYQRTPGGPWRQVGDAWPAVAGGAGLGWGRGLHGDGRPGGTDKREGDRRSPAGAFAITAAYGYDALPPSGTRLPYAELTEGWRCVDDPASPRYNQVFDAANLPQGWTSAETMRRDDELYRWVLFIDHNPLPALPGRGSCIFFHVWSGPASATVGCTAMDRGRLEELLRWLDPAAHPVYVLLPEETYRGLASVWGLPRAP